MNIAIFASAFHPHVGGVEELARQMAHAYRRAGHGAIVLTNRWPRSLPSYEEYEGIALYRLAMRIPEGSLKAKWNYHLTHAAIVRRMLAILQRHQIDILQVQCISSSSYYAMLARRALQLPFVVTTQGELTMDAEHTYQRPTFMNHLLPQLAEEADVMMACSQKTMRDLEKHINRALGPKARIIYNGASLDDYARSRPFQHSKPYILGIGRLVPQKGFDVLLRAFAQAKITAHDLILAGDGPKRAALQALAVELKTDNVHFLGSAPRELTTSLLKGCAFFVLPSRADEGLPLVGLEAMAAGKAIIATPTGGVLEIMAEGENVAVVPKEDVTALAVALRRLSDDKALRERLGANGKARGAAFDWDAVAAQYLELYRTLRHGPKESA